MWKVLCNYVITQAPTFNSTHWSSLPKRERRIELETTFPERRPLSDLSLQNLLFYSFTSSVFCRFQVPLHLTEEAIRCTVRSLLGDIYEPHVHCFQTCHLEEIRWWKMRFNFFSLIPKMQCLSSTIFAKWRFIRAIKTYIYIYILESPEAAKYDIITILQSRYNIIFIYWIFR